MSDTKGERREQQRHKAQHGMQVTGKYFWHAIANSQAKREQARQKRQAKQPSQEPPPEATP
jgi:hypothetical protein